MAWAERDEILDTVGRVVTTELSWLNPINRVAAERDACIGYVAGCGRNIHKDGQSKKALD